MGIWGQKCVAKSHIGNTEGGDSAFIMGSCSRTGPVLRSACPSIRYNKQLVACVWHSCILWCFDAEFYKLNQGKMGKGASRHDPVGRGTECISAGILQHAEHGHSPEVFKRSSLPWTSKAVTWFGTLSVQQPEGNVPSTHDCSSESWVWAGEQT